ncbi:MAG: HD-GYP domain-containing protein, partial [Thermodesulfovibrionales bacterium]
MKENDVPYEVFLELSRSYNELEDLFMGFVRAMVNALEAKSQWTRGHSERVTAFAQEIAYEMNLDETQRKAVIIASLLHDIGKIGTHGAILDKKNSLSADEYDILKFHPVQGAEILRGIKQFEDVVLIVKHHHERIDGTGYPDGLKGEEIPLGARIVYVADAFDAMTEDRPYQPAISIEASISELRRSSGTQFDPVVVDAWLRVLEMHKD